MGIAHGLFDPNFLTPSATQHNSRKATNIGKLNTYCYHDNARPHKSLVTPQYIMELI